MGWGSFRLRNYHFTIEHINMSKARAKKRRMLKAQYDNAMSVLKAHGYSLNKPPPESDQMLCDYFVSAKSAYAEISNPIIEAPRKKRKSRPKKPKRRQPLTTKNVAWMPRDEWEKQTKAFYNSQRWKELRYEVFRRDGAACGCCGGRASDGIRLHVDHIKPRSRYPELQWEITNLQILCEDCNFGKSNYYSDDWRVKMG